MKSLTKYSQSILAVSLALAFIPTVSAAITSAELQASKLAEKQVKTNGKTYRFVKFYDKHSNNIAEVILDENNREVSKAQLAEKNAISIKSTKSKANSKINKDLRDYLATMPLSRSAEKIKVNVALNTEAPDHSDMIPTQGSVVLEEGVVTVLNSGKKVSSVELQQERERTAARIKKNRKQLKAQRQKVARDLLDHRGWSRSVAVGNQIAEGLPTLTLELSRTEIEQLIKEQPELIQGIERYSAPQDNIDAAMRDSRVDPYALNYSGRRGSGIGIYMTESGCANSGHVTNYSKLAGSRTDHAENVSGIIRAVSPDSYLYCRGGAVLPQSSDLDGVSGNPPIYISTRSNGSNNGTNEYRTLDRDWDNFVYNEQILALNSAGNAGNSNDQISSPGKGFNILTVGAYDDSNDTMASFSSANDPQMGNQKPEISGPGVSITAGGHTKSGTSMSTPHAAAFAADLMSAYDFLRLKPMYAKAFMLAGARKSVSGGADAVGVGGLDFYEAYFGGSNKWWSGNNASFDTYDDQDGQPNSNAIEVPVEINASESNVRVVFAWMNRGTYTYNNRNSSSAIGMDMDIQVLDPNGTVVGSSASYGNPYEMVDFDPTITGTYTVKITRYANNDTSAKFEAGLSVSW